jgi:DNA-3-methyladenine glycosylase I
VPDPVRCPWCGDDELYVRYHDEEWGTPVRDEARHFEFLLLETMQAGLSWRTILGKRENYRAAFDGFDCRKIAGYGEAKLLELMGNPGIVRNRRKIEGAVRNAAAFLRVREEFGSFDAYVWSWTGGRPLVNRWTEMRQIPVSTELSDRLSKDMKRRGFAYVGSVTLYSHLQAIGVVNDHVVGCFRWRELAGSL